MCERRLTSRGFSAELFGRLSAVRKPGSASLAPELPTSLLRVVNSSAEFEMSVLAIRMTLKGRSEIDKDTGRFLNRMYYLLGWMVGDAGKEFAEEKPWARIKLNLCRKHPQNLELGYYVMICVGDLGVPWTRISDGRPYEGEPHGSHCWNSYFSAAIEWLHVACLGLGRDDLTSYTRVKMRWLLSASEAHRLWFLRGIADSDGTVNVKDRSVVLTTHPNGEFFLELLKSLGLQARLYISKGEQYVSLRAKVAMRVRLFNPEIPTHRGLILAKVANAKAFQRRWPPWLENRVKQMSDDGLSASEIRNRVLLEHDTYIKLGSIRRKLR